jgi:hypothetical protein
MESTHRDEPMNWARALHEIAENGANDSTIRAALARDTVYMPSELAARLLPDDVFCRHAPPHPHERVMWDSTALGGDRRSQVR